jgi:hypothetical protein
LLNFKEICPLTRMPVPGHRHTWPLYIYIYIYIFFSLFFAKNAQKQSLMSDMVWHL